MLRIEVRLLGGPARDDFVEKVEKSSVKKTRQIAIRWNIAIQNHLRPVADLARCPIDKLAGPPADFLNAAPIGLPENRISPKGSFSTPSPRSRPPLQLPATALGPKDPMGV